METSIADTKAATEMQKTPKSQMPKGRSRSKSTNPIRTIPMSAPATIGTASRPPSERLGMAEKRRPHPYIGSAARTVRLRPRVPQFAMKSASMVHAMEANPAIAKAPVATNQRQRPPRAPRGGAVATPARSPASSAPTTTVIACSSPGDV